MTDWQENKTDPAKASVVFLFILAVMGIITLAASVGIFHLPKEGLLSFIGGQ